MGALYDLGGQFATGELAAQVGLYLPFFKELKVYVEALGRGVPAFIKKDALLPGVHPQSALGLGLSFHPHARVDLGVCVHRGFGGLAPWSVSINFLTLSIGKTYQERKATPALHGAAEVAREFATWAAEQWTAIDPYLKRDCILYDDNHQPTTPLGELGPDGTGCIYRGLRVPIGPHFWRNKSDTLLCNDSKLKDCFLFRTSRDDAWEPIHPMLVNEDCFAYYNGQPWMRVGTPTADKQGCERDAHVIPVGQTLKPDRDAAGHYCYDEPDKATKQTKKLWCLQPPEHPQTDAKYLMRRWAGGIDRAQEDLARQDAQVRKILDEGAQGVPLHATTPVKEAEGAARETINRIKNATPDDAEHVFHAVLTGGRNLLKKPLRQQLGDLAEEVGDAMASPSTYVPSGGVLGRGTHLAADSAEVAADATKVGRNAARAAKAAEHVEQAVADAAKAEKKAAKTLLSTETEHAAQKAGRQANSEARSALPRHTPIGPDGKPIDTPRTVFRRETPNGRVHHYQTFEAPTAPEDPRPVALSKRFDGVGKAHGSVATPHIHEPGKPGKRPDLARLPRPDELPRGFK
jgi:hypothetical protein